MDEIFEISDRVTVLRDGEIRGTLATGETDEDAITRLMIGRSLAKVEKLETDAPGEVVLEARDLACGFLFENICFRLRAGEVVGLSGLVGAGRTEIAETLFGMRRPTAGEILLHGRPIVFRSSADAVAAGISLVPESRKEQGLVLGMNCRDNITLSTIDRMTWLNGLIDHTKELEVFETYRKQLDIKTPGWSQTVGNLSGGNQQKIVIGKWLYTDPKVLILDEPTRGIDVGSKSEIHRLIRELARSGYAVLVISSEMPEVLGVSDRILAMYSGRIVRELDAATAAEDDLIQAITGQ
jgi:ribose transport system ATP-binding protein